MAKNGNKDMLRYEREKREFIDGLRNFHYNRGTSFHLTPRCGNKEVDLYLLYQKVTQCGGWKKVTENRLWENVIEQLKLPKACLNADAALKHIYIRYLNLYEHIHFLGEDPKTVDTRRDDEGPIRKKHCGPQYNVPLTYNHAQHDVADNLRAGFGFSTRYARHSDYDKLEKALMSGLPNEVDFVINVCTLLSNESKHTLKLERCAVLIDLLIAHIGVFREDDCSLESLYEKCWRKNSDRDFLTFWYDTIHDGTARQLISFSRNGRGSMCGQDVLQLGRNLGVEDKEGIRITQVAIIIRNLSFDIGNMKYLSNCDLVFRFLLLCIHCEYGTLRQLALDTVSNLSAMFVLDPADSFKSETILDLLVKCVHSSDKFAVVTGLEMISKLSRTEDNEYVISEKLDISLYEEITKYLTIQDIQLIVYSLEALYQLSEIGEETNSKIAEASHTVETLVSLITVEAQSYGPNSLIGIKVVEYCPPPHLAGGIADGMPGAVGPPAGTSQAQTPGSQSSQIPANSSQKKSGSEKVTPPEPPVPPSPIETTTCNWLQATYQTFAGGVVPHVALYTEYLSFCKTFQQNQPLSSPEFLKTVEVVFPRSTSVMGQKAGGAKQMCVQGIKKRPSQLRFSIAVCKPAAPSSVVSSTPCSVRPPLTPGGAIRSPNLAQRLASPPPRTIVPSTGSKRSNTSIYSAGLPLVQQTVTAAATFTSQPLQRVCAPTVSIPVQTTTSTVGVVTVNQQTMAGTSGTVTVPTYTLTGGLAAQGYVTDTIPPPTIRPATPTTGNKSKSAKKKILKKNTPVLPKAEPTPPGLATIMPKLVPTQANIAPAQMTAQIGIPQTQVIQNQQLIQNVQFSTQDVVYQTVDQQNPENKVLVKTLLAQKIRAGNVIIQQPVQGMMNVQNMELGASGEVPTQTIQYQTTSFPQTVQPTTYIQYAAPASTTQAIVQQPSQGTSQVQTFVVQPNGEMYVQGQMPTSSLNTQQQLITQQPMMVSQQTMMVSQQPMLGTQQQMVMPQQQFISQPQLLQQSHTAGGSLQNSQFISQPHQTNTIIPTSQVIIQPQSSQLSSQMACSSVSLTTTESLPSTVSSVVLQQTCASLSTSAAIPASSINHSSTTTDSYSASQVLLHSTGLQLPNDSNDQSQNPLNIDTTALASEQQEACVQIVDIDKPTNESDTPCDSLAINSSKPSMYENNTNSAFTDYNVQMVEDPVMKLDNSSTSAVRAEIESAVGSIMDDNTDTQDDEPVMIENDGNELMFEQQKYHVPNPTTEMYVGDEAALAVEQLEQMEQSSEVEDAVGLIVNTDSVDNDIEQCDTIAQAMEVTENDVNLNEQMIDDQNLVIDDGNVDYKEGSVDKESSLSDEELIAKFRAETPINVPLVSENGLLEQDFEARLAVENLLKDVEFKVNDDEGGEMNIIFACEPEDDSSSDTLKLTSTVTSVESNVPIVQETRDNGVSVTSESHKTNPAIVNHNGSTSVTPKPLNSVSQPLVNGIDTDHGQPLMNGHLSSPECQSVPSPGIVNGGEKLVNGITDENHDLDDARTAKTIVDKVLKLNGVVNHKISSNLQESKVIEVSEDNSMDTSERLADKQLGSDDILAQSMIDINKGEDILEQTDKLTEQVKGDEGKTDPDGDILARSIFENGIQPSDCEMPESEPTNVAAVVKQIIPYGNIMTVQINNNTIPITFTNNALITSKNSVVSGQINVCNSRHIPTPETARDGEQSCDSTSSSIATSEQLSVMVSDKHSIKVASAGTATVLPTSQSKPSHKESKKSLASPKSSSSESQTKKAKSNKKRSRSKSGGSGGGGNDSRPSSVSSPAASTTALPEYMCEWSQCRQCFDNCRSVFNHVCSVHLKTEYDGLCKWEGCESLIRKRWSLFTHVQDHHCSDSSLKVASQRRLQSFQTGQKIAAPTIPAMVYPKDAANQAIKRFLPKPPYPEFTEGREGPVTKHIRLTSALILRNLARYSREGRSLLKKHERLISYSCMSAVESSTALASCLNEIVSHQ